MEVVYRDFQIEKVQSKVGIAKSVVKKVIPAYIKYLCSELDEGRSIKFLNICYFEYPNSDKSAYKTLAYISRELANSLDLVYDEVYQVLLAYEDCIVGDMKRYYTYSIWGLLSLGVRDTKNGIKARVVRSSRYTGYSFRVRVLGLYRRKVEVG